jgi:hypothetical protein
VKTLLQGRQETHFLVVLLSGTGATEPTIVTADIPGESNTGDAKNASLVMDSIDASKPEE